MRLPEALAHARIDANKYDGNDGALSGETGKDVDPLGVAH